MPSYAYSNPTPRTQQSRRSDASGICNYLANPMDFYPGFLTHPKEPTAASQFSQPLAKPRFYGLEWEMRTSLDPSDIFEYLPNFAIAKSDSSIAGHGFEVVTVPATLRYHKFMWNSLNKQADDILANEIEVHRSCGVHVHVSRTAFTYLLHIKLVWFFNHVNHADLIEKLSGRQLHNNVTHYAMAVPLDRKAAVRQVWSNEVPSNRYLAINDSPEHTIEFRGFASTNKVTDIIRYLETVDSLLEFCKATGWSKLNPAHYKEFVIKNRQHYRTLAKFVETI